MPLPRPDKNQSQKEFINKCMDDSAMLEEFPNGKQRAAVCYSQYEQATKSKARQWEEFDNQRVYDVIIF